MRNISMFVLAITVAAITVGIGAQSGGRTLNKVKEYDLPGPAGKRFDYLTIDSDDGYLISAH